MAGSATILEVKIKPDARQSLLAQAFEAHAVVIAHRALVLLALRCGA